MYGSARLDYYRKGRDSLQGRYHYYLHSCMLSASGRGLDAHSVAYLLRFGGFRSLPGTSNVLPAGCASTPSGSSMASSRKE